MDILDMDAKERYRGEVNWVTMPILDVNISHFSKTDLELLESWGYADPVKFGFLLAVIHDMPEEKSKKLSSQTLLILQKAVSYRCAYINVDRDGTFLNGFKVFEHF